MTPATFRSAKATFAEGLRMCYPQLLSILFDGRGSTRTRGMTMTETHRFDDVLERSSVDISHVLGMDGLERPKCTSGLPAKIIIHQEDPPLDVRVHWHTGCEIIYPRNITIDCIIDGRMVVVEPGSFVLISPGSLHSVHPHQTTFRQDVLSVSFDGEQLARLYPEMSHCRLSADAPGADETSRTDMIELLERVYDRICSKQDCNGATMFDVCSMLYSTLSLMFRDFLVDTERVGTSGSAEGRDRMAAIMSYLQNHFQESLSSNDVAAHFGYSREHFSRMFKAYSDVTLKGYITELRISAATEMLCSSPEMSCAQVRTICGFPDGKGFVSAFERRFGVSPGEYRRTHLPA